MANIAALADKLLALPTTDKLTVARVMIETGKLDVAERMIVAALDDLVAKRLLAYQRSPLTSKEKRADEAHVTATSTKCTTGADQ